MPVFFNAISAIANDISVELTSLIHNQFVIGFVVGLLMALLISALIITERPIDYPLLLFYNKSKGFEKMAKQDDDGTYNDSYSRFIKMYYHARLSLFFFVSLFFVVVISAIIFT